MDQRPVRTRAGTWPVAEPVVDGVRWYSEDFRSLLDADLPILHGHRARGEDLVDAGHSSDMARGEAQVLAGSNTLVSVRQMTQHNAGRASAGVDGQVALTSRARTELAVLVHRTAKSVQPLPVRSSWESTRRPATE